MSITTLIASIAGMLFVLFGIWYAVGGKFLAKRHWIIPTILSILFFSLSLYAVLTEGALGFWIDHTRSFWGNQIWLDLLLAASIGWVLMVPEAKKLGMRPLPWFFLVITTGSIGYLVMLARLLYLRENATS
ncbi:MAG: hypothetical protein AAF629_19480 [Chloroflexota bacterium]